LAFTIQKSVNMSFRNVAVVPAKILFSL